MEAWPVFAWADEHALALWLRTSRAYPVLETVHIAGLATMFGSLFVVELALLGATRRIAVGVLAREVLPWTLAAFALVAGSGLAMFFARAAELAANPVFRIKLVLVLCAGINAAWLHLRGPLDAASRMTRVQAVLSLLIWLAVIVCGRWIAYF